MILDPVNDTASPKRLRYRAWHRGIREMDYLFGRFADAHLETMTNEELRTFERLLEASDDDVFAWLSGKLAVPHEYDTDVFRTLALYTRQNPLAQTAAQG